jgi:hypothetical protein
MPQLTSQVAQQFAGLLSDEGLVSDAPATIVFEMLPLAVSLRCTPRGIEKVLVRLEAEGAVVWHRKRRGGHGSTGGTRVTVNNPAEFVAAVEVAQ